MKEYKLPSPWGNPYDVVPTKGGAEVWTRVDVERPHFTDQHQYRRGHRISPAAHDNIPPRVRRRDERRPVLWIGNNHGAAIVKVEPTIEAKGDRSWLIVEKANGRAIARPFAWKQVRSSLRIMPSLQHSGPQDIRGIESVSCGFVVRIRSSSKGDRDAQPCL